VGWMAISVSTIAACFWAFWGSNENFHEGWFAYSIWQNIGLMIAQYLSPMLSVIVLSAIAFHWPRLAFPVFGISALAAVYFFRHSPAGIVLFVIPLVVLGIAYHYGSPFPRRWAWRCLIILPLATAAICGAYPGWLAIHRLDDGNYGIRRIEGNGVSLIWAPEGPGWPGRGQSWQEARRSCAHLNANGRSSAESAQNIWRLPTVDEAVRSLVFRGHNAGGVWDPARNRAHYRTVPDKDSPLWRVHSQVIYWWTSNEKDESHAYYITYNGYIQLAAKGTKANYLAFRCVWEPPKQDVPKSGD